MDNFNQNNQNNQNNQYNQQYDQQYNQQYDQQYNQPYQYPQYQEQPEQPGRNFAIASLVLGIVSFFCCGTICSILGIIFGVISKQRQKENNSMATAGIVLSIITLVLGIIFTIIAISTGLLEAYSYSYMY